MGRIREGHLVAMAAVAVALVVSILAWGGWVGYQAAMDAVRRLADERAQVVERHALQVFTEARSLMNATDVALAWRGMEQVETDRNLWNALKQLTEATEYVEALAVFDTSGRMVLSTRSFPPANFDGSKESDFHAAMAIDGLFFGAMRASPLSGRPIFVLARRLPGGEGLVAAGIDLHRLTQVYVPKGASSGSFGIYRRDGAPLFQYPLPNAAVGDAMESVPADEDTPVPGEGITVARTLENFPVVAVASLNPLEGAGALWSHFLSRLSAGFISGLFIIAFTLLAIRQFRRERAANTALVDLNRSLEETVAERTERLRQALADQRRATSLAEAATQAKSRFLTAVGHDLRQPMQALRLYHQSLSLKINDEAIQRLLARMSEAIAAAEDLLGSTMEVGRIEAGQVTIAAAEVPFHSIAALVEGQAAHGDLRIVANGAVLWVDRVVLGRILGNLVANAVRHGRGGRVLVGCRRVAGGGLRIVVCDQGGGIPADKLDAIFEEFYQLDNASRSRDKGLGLGLSIARRLADASGFGISVTSSSRGSTFSVHLPPRAVVSWPVRAARLPQAT